jgi:hypothetical protein
VLLTLDEHVGQFPFQPGMEHRIGSRQDSFGSEGATRRAKEGQQPGRPISMKLGGSDKQGPLLAS